jgi:hypothetical protein
LIVKPFPRASGTLCRIGAFLTLGFLLGAAAAPRGRTTSADEALACPCGRRSTNPQQASGAWGTMTWTDNGSQNGACQGNAPNCVPITNCLFNFTLTVTLTGACNVRATHVFCYAPDICIPPGQPVPAGSGESTVTNFPLACGQLSGLNYEADCGGSWAPIFFAHVECKLCVD